MSRGERLTVQPASLVARDDAHSVAALGALRALYRDYLEQQGLDLPAVSSVTVRPANEEAA